MKRALTCGLVLVLAVGLYWLWPEGQPTVAPPVATGAAQPKPVAAAPKPEPRAREMRTRNLRPGETVPAWLRPELRHGRSLLEEEEEKTELTLDDVCALKGALVVKDKPWVKVPGMRIRLTPVWLDTVMPGDSSGFDDKFFLEAEGETDKWGRFEIEKVLLRENLFLVVQRGGTVYEVIKLTELPPAGQTKDLGDIPFEERGSVRGLVVGRHGDPVHDIVVRAVDDVYNRGANKDAALHRARVLRAAQYDPGRRRGGKQQRRMLRKRDRYLPFPSAKTDAEGRFVLHGVRPGETTLFLNGQRRHGVKDEVLVVAGQATDIGTIVVESAEMVRLRMLRQVKPPLPLGRAAVSVQPAAWPVSVETVWTDKDGYCRVYLPEGDFHVEARERGSRGWRKCERVRPKRGLARFVIKPSSSVRVLVRDENGRDIDDAEVGLFATDQVEGANVRIGWQTGRQRDRFGYFNFPGVPNASRAEIVATAPGYAPAVHTPATGKNGVVVLRLQKTISLDVKTVDHDNRPLSGVRISAMFLPPIPRWKRIPAGEHWYRLTKYKPLFLGKTDENAELTVRGLWHGRIRLGASFPGYTQSLAPAFELRAGLQLVIKMRHLAHLDGKLLLDGAVPPRPFEIHAIPADRVEGGERNPFLDRHRTVTAADGSFSFHDLFAGKWALRVAAPTDPSGDTVARVWPEGETEFAFPKAGLRVYHVMNLKRAESKFQLRGRVRLVGRPCDAPLHVGVRMVLPDFEFEMPEWAKKSGAWRHQLRAEAARQRERALGAARTLAKVPVVSGGEFGVPVDRPGTYRVTLEAVFGGRSQILRSHDVEIPKKSDEKPPPVDFTVATGDVRLFLIDFQGNHLGHRVLELRQQLPKGSDHKGATLRVCSDTDGTIDLPGVPAGRYELLNAYRGRRAERASFVVARGTLVQRYLELR